jgi:cell division protein FtsQ
MDRGGRVVRSLRLAYGGAAAPALTDAASRKVLLRGERVTRGPLSLRLPLNRPPPLLLEIGLTVMVLAAAAGYGAFRGGQFDAFVARHGGVADVAARALGFGIDVVTVSGAAHMSEESVLSIAGISSRSSLPFFDVGAARSRLEADPLVADASVRKLYPNRIVIDIVERTPYALWQKDGEIKAIAADGAPIDDVRDGRFAGLPFVVGEGANERASEFSGLLDALEELRTRVEAGVLIGGRRWNLRLKNGVDVKLPETDPKGAVVRLLALERANRILERDVLALDLRAPDRVFVRLTQESAAAWADAHAPKKKDAAP